MGGLSTSGGSYTQRGHWQAQHRRLQRGLGEEGFDGSPAHADRSVDVWSGLQGPGGSITRALGYPTKDRHLLRWATSAPAAASRRSAATGKPRYLIYSHTGCMQVRLRGPARLRTRSACGRGTSILPQHLSVAGPSSWSGSARRTARRFEALPGPAKPPASQAARGHHPQQRLFDAWSFFLA